MTQPYPTSPNDPGQPQPPPIHHPHTQPLHSPVPDEPMHAPVPEVTPPDQSPDEPPNPGHDRHDRTK
jgi:hypothetical protein